MSTLNRIVTVLDSLQGEWLTKILSLGLHDASGNEVTEEFLREHLKYDTPIQPRRGPKSSSKKTRVEKKDCCTAAKLQKTIGDYSKARCSKSGCTRDDGHGNLLCESHGAQWDSVSSNSIGGQICYGIGQAAKRGYGGAEWLGIYDKDVPPIFRGQSCSVVDENDKWQERESMSKISKDGDRKKGAFHEPLKAWEEGNVQLTEDTTDAEVQERPEVSKTQDNMYVIDGASYIISKHEDVTYLFRAYGEDLPDPSDVDEAAAQLKGDKVCWLNDDYENEHDEYVCNL